MSVTLHHGTSFVVADELGDVASGSDHGYFHLDTRFLSRHELRLDGKRPVLLQASTTEDNDGWHFLTNPALDGAARATLGVTVHRIVGGGLREEVDVENFGDGEARLALSVALACDFAYILTVKKEASGGGGDWHPRVRRSRPSRQELALELETGAQPHRTTIAFSAAPDGIDGEEVRFDLALPRRGRWHLDLDVEPTIGDERVEADPRARGRAASARHLRDELESSWPRLGTDHPVLGDAFTQASRDLAALRMKAERTTDDRIPGVCRRPPAPAHRAAA